MKRNALTLCGVCISRLWTLDGIRISPTQPQAFALAFDWNIIQIPKRLKKSKIFFCWFFFLRLPKECVWNYSQAAFMHLATTAAGSETFHRLLGILSFSLVTMHFWNYTTCLGRFVPLLQKCSESREDIIVQSTSSIKLDLHSENEVLVYAHKMRYI